MLYNRLPKVLSDYAEAVEDAKHANSGYEGELRIGFLDIYDISELFDDVIREFREAYEKIAMSPGAVCPRENFRPVWLPEIWI